MSISSTYYLDAANLTAATSVYSDLELTILAPDGFYSDNTISRQQSSGILLAVETCPFPCPDPCVGYGGGGGEFPAIFQHNADVGYGTGAICIYFDPASVTHGFRVTYDGVVYNKLSSFVVGVQQSANYGHYTIVGDTIYNTIAGCKPWVPSGATITEDVYLWNVTANQYYNTGTTQTNTILTNDFFPVGPTNAGPWWMVIPKPNSTPNTLLVEGLSTCYLNFWGNGIACPAPLYDFTCSNMFASASVPCAAPMSNTYYYWPVNTEVQFYPIGLNDYIFLDANGEFPANDGYYLTGDAGGSGKVIHVVNGVVAAITNCI